MLKFHFKEYMKFDAYFFRSCLIQVRFYTIAETINLLDGNLNKCQNNKFKILPP